MDQIYIVNETYIALHHLDDRLGFKVELTCFVFHGGHQHLVIIAQHVPLNCTHTQTMPTYAIQIVPMYTKIV